MSEQEVLISEDNIANINIQILNNELNQHKLAFFRDRQKNSTLKGFRKGKAPLNMIEKLFDTQAKEYAFEVLLNDKYAKILQMNRLQAISSPKVTLHAQEELLRKYQIEVEVVTPVVLNQYLGIELKKQELISFEEALQNTLNTISQTYPQLEPYPQTYFSQANDAIVADFEMVVDGKIVESNKDYKFVLGSKTMPPEFEKELLNVSVSTYKEVTIDFPNDYHHTDVAGKTALIKLTIKSVNKVVFLTDEDLSKALNYDSYENFLNHVKFELENKRNDEVRANLETQVLEYLVNSHNFKLPKTLVDRELQSQKMKNPNGTHEELLKSAEEGVRIDLILASIYEKHPEIHLTQEFLNQNVSNLANKANKSPEQVVNEMKEAGLLDSYLNYLKNVKVVDFIIEMAEYK